MNITQDHALACMILERQRDYHRDHGNHRPFFCGRCREFSEAIKRRRDLLERTLLAKYDDPEVARHWFTEAEWREIEARSPSVPR